MKTMKKSLVLAAAIAALSAIAIPSMASAANWGPVNTYHNLTSPSSITFTLHGGPVAGYSCASGPTFGALVRTPASSLMDMTSTTTNLPCTGTGLFAGCNYAFDMIGLPVWTVNGTNPANVSINSVSIEGRKTGGGSNCLAPFFVTGTLAGGVWSNLTRSLAFTNGTGLTWGPSPGGSTPVTVTASEFIKDTTSPFVSLL